MHAARAIHKQREKRVEKEKVEEKRRPSATSISSRIPRSPAISIDTRRTKHSSDDSDNLNFSVYGFIIAGFGVVPLIVGTFVEVPGLWEIGLGLTLVGIFIGVVFWCTELCAEAKKFSKKKKNQLSSRGKIEDSNLLQVPERKFGNGLDSRRSSFQSDSISLIAPIEANLTPKHLQILPPHLSSRNSISQYSSSDISKSDESSQTLQRINGHLGGGGQMPLHPPPKLLLRGTGRRDDGRIVSLVQPEPGLDEDSDSDAETVIEAPAGKPKIIQVQSCQEKGRGQSPNADNLLTPTTPTNPTTPTFSMENEMVPPLNPLAAQHRTIRMPVMPQEVDKLQRCECGRYLLTERDKLVGIRIPVFGGGGRGSSMPTTTYNSPSLTGVSGAGTVPSTRKIFAGGQTTSSGSQSAGALASMPDSAGDSENDLSSQGNTPVSNEHKIISVNPNGSSDIESRKEPNEKESKGGEKSPPPAEESIVQVEPTLNSSDLLRRNEKTEHKEETSIITPENIKNENENSEDRNDKEILNELLTEMTAGIEEEANNDNADGDDFEEGAGQSGEKTEDNGDDECGDEGGDDEDDDEFEHSISKKKPDETVVEIEAEEKEDEQEERGDASAGEKRKQLQQLHQLSAASQHPSRPTFLPLPVIHTDSNPVSKTDNINDENENPTENSTIDENSGPVTVMLSSASSTSTVVFLDGDAGSTSSEQTYQGNREDCNGNKSNSNESDENSNQTCEEEFTKLRDGDENDYNETPRLKSRESSLEELLDKIERKQDSEVLAVVVQ